MKILIEESVLRQALGAMELMRRRPDICKELNAALGAAEKVEPVAWINRSYRYCQFYPPDPEFPAYKEMMPVYAHPAPAVPEVGADKTGEK